MRKRRFGAKVQGLARWTAIFVVALLSWAAGSAAARSPTPGLRLVHAHPVTVHGSAFLRHERVRLVLRVGGERRTRLVRASSRGTFRAAFAGVAHDRCSADLSLLATGSHGSRASSKRPQTLCPVPN